MIVYIESNFILEIALEQEQVASALSILSLAEKGQIKLVFPGFALSEPFSTIMHRDRERINLHNSLKASLEQLQRSEPHKEIMINLGPVIAVLKDAAKRELDLLHLSVDNLLSVGTSIALDASIFKRALTYRERFNLSSQDSIIYASVINDLQERPVEEVKCFLSRDRRAFGDDPEIKVELASYNCRYISSFAQGLNFIESHLQKTE